MTQAQGKAWYAIRSKPHKEKSLYGELLSRGIETFYPQLRVNPVNPRARKWVPYFPGYLFVHVDLEKTGLRPMNRIPYSIGLVMFNDHAPTVPEALLHKIDQKLHAISEAGGETFFDIQPGDTVKLVNGGFAGYEAIFEERLNGGDRVRILIKMLSDRYVPAEVDAGMIKKQD
jgi:transcription antitermination factor NusG